MLHHSQHPAHLSYSVTNPGKAETLVSEKHLHIDASPDVLWQWLTQPNFIPQWQHTIKQVVNYPDALQEPSNKIGCEQKLLLKDGREILQVVTDWKEGALIGYANVEGSQYTGIYSDLEIELYKLINQGQGTEVHLLSYLEYRPKLKIVSKSSFSPKKFHWENRAKLIFLKWMAEHSRTSP